MIAADLGRAALLATVPASALLHVLGMPQLYAVAFTVAMLSTIFEVADRSFLPSVVGRDEIMPANAALTASSAVAEFGAFGISGFLVQLVTAPIAVVVGALTFLWSALFISRIRRSEPPPQPLADREPVLREIRDGLRLLFRDPILRPIALAGASVSGLFGIFGATYLLFANQELGLSPAVIGVIAGVGGAGSLIGAVLAGRVTRRFGLGRVLVWSLVLGSLGNAFIPLAPAGLPLVAIGCLLTQQLVADSAITVFEIGDVTVRQSMVPDRQLGRVNASVHVLGLGAQLAGTVLGGVLAEGVEIRGALVVGSLGGLIGAFFIILSPVRRLLDVPGGARYPRASAHQSSLARTCPSASNAARRSMGVARPRPRERHATDVGLPPAFSTISERSGVPRGLVASARVARRQSGQLFPPDRGIGWRLPLGGSR